MEEADVFAIDEQAGQFCVGSSSSATNGNWATALFPLAPTRPGSPAEVLASVVTQFTTTTSRAATAWSTVSA